MATAEHSDEGLRDRKKRRTRQAISDAATRLFAADGFEHVTLAQIAEAAEVSVKTIFNHFGCKEELYFDRAEEVRAVLRRTIAERPEGESPIAALHRLLRENFAPVENAPWSALEDPRAYRGFRGFLSVQDGSPALRAHRLVIEEELRGLLVEVLGPELGLKARDPVLHALAAMLVAIMQLRERTLRDAVREDLPAKQVRRRVRAAVDEAFARLETAFGDLG